MFRKLLISVAALGMLVMPFAFATAGPAAADSPANCYPNSPGFEQHLYTDVWGSSGKWLASWTYQWWDDCYNITWIQYPPGSNFSFGTTGGYVNCGAFANGTDGSMQTLPQDHAWTYSIDLYIANPGHNCTDSYKVGTMHAVLDASNCCDDIRPYHNNTLVGVIGVTP